MVEECSNSVRRVASALNYECSYCGDPSTPPRGDVNNLNGEVRRTPREYPYFRISRANDKEECFEDRLVKLKRQTFFLSDCLAHARDSAVNKGILHRVCGRYYVTVYSLPLWMALRFSDHVF